MSATTIVDLNNSTVSQPSLNSFAQPSLASGAAYISPASGAVIGLTVDLINAGNTCNIYAMGCPAFGSGQLQIQVQCSDSTASGTFTDPTSGLPQMPSILSSGGILILNSGGLLNGVVGTAQSGNYILSGFDQFAFFQRPQRYARLNVVTGDFFCGVLQAGFISQSLVTGSGAGFTLSPTSGAVNV